MARRNTTWLPEMAAEMRRVGAIQATRRQVHKDGTVDEWSLTLGPPGLAENLSLQPAYSPEPVRPEQAAKQRLIERLTDLYGRTPTDFEVAMAPPGV